MLALQIFPQSHRYTKEIMSVHVQMFKHACILCYKIMNATNKVEALLVNFSILHVFINIFQL